MQDAPLPYEVVFIETLGIQVEKLGFPRIAGRILGLLALSDAPLHLDDIATRLQVSRASVSTNTRLLLGVQLIEEVGIPGDRRIYFRFHPKAFEGRLPLLLGRLELIGAWIQQGMSMIPPERKSVQQRFAQALEFQQFMTNELQGALERWRRRHQEGA